MRSMWNEAKMLTLHYNILLNCCVLCILYGAASQTESIFKVAQAMCASQLLFHERQACYVGIISSVCILAFSKSTRNSNIYIYIYIYIYTHTPAITYPQYMQIRSHSRCTNYWQQKESVLCHYFIYITCSQRRLLLK